jgi:hypothetical protein
MSSHIQRANILALYRAKLRISVSLGHMLGNWNTIYEYSECTIPLIHSKKVHNSINPGTVIWNNVRKEYKRNMNEIDVDKIDRQIDYGFIWLMQINRFAKNNRELIIFKSRNK